MNGGEDVGAGVSDNRLGLHGDPCGHPTLEQYGPVGREVGIERENGTAVRHGIGAHTATEDLRFEYAGGRMLADSTPHHFHQFINQEIRQMAIDDHGLDIEHTDGRQQRVRQGIGTIIQPLLYERSRMINDSMKMRHTVKLDAMRRKMSPETEK